jgi:hypothetical protein
MLYKRPILVTFANPVPMAYYDGPFSNRVTQDIAIDHIALIASAFVLFLFVLAVLCTYCVYRLLVWCIPVGACEEEPWEIEIDDEFI